jgi:hypothetical protein
VRELDSDRVVIGTDAGAVRELPAAYADEHLEHAYALTGHSLQGGTVERAIVVASPRDLTAGWSYPALSRARGETRVVIVDAHDDERSEFAPAGSIVPREPCLARVARRMLERDDEDLAVEQLGGRYGEHPGRAAERAESRVRPKARERLQDLERRVVSSLSHRARVVRELEELPKPERNRFTGEHDPHAVDRAHLSSVLEAVERELQTALDEHGRLAGALESTPRLTPKRWMEQELAERTREHAYIGAMAPECHLGPSRQPKANRELDLGLER